MGAHNKQHHQEINRSSANWQRFGDGVAGTTLATSSLLDKPVTVMGASDITLTLPEAAVSGNEGLLTMIAGNGTGTLTVESSETWGGLGSTTTLTVQQGGFGFIMMGPNADTAGTQYWFGPSVANAIS